MPNPAPSLLASERVLLPGADAPVPATLRIEGDRIAEVRSGVSPGVRLVGHVIAPGYVDTHCHGAAGVSFDTDSDPMPAIAHHRARGTTTLVASLVTATPDDLHAQLDRLRPLVDAGELAGVHLEGPFLSEARRGAHEPRLLRDPDPAVLEPLLADPVVRMVTLAPELPGSPAAVRLAVRHGVVAAFGHSDADAATTRSAIDAGVTVATHLFNAMRPIGHRAPGPVPVLLHDPRVVVELIGDGVHVAPEVLLMAIDAAGPDRVSLVTDALAATGQPDGPQRLGGLDVVVRDGIARLATADGSEGALAGSTLTLDRAVALVVAAGVPLAHAVRMASTTPARAHGLGEVGVLEAGRRADLLLLDDAAGVHGVMRRGEWTTPPALPVEETAHE